MFFFYIFFVSITLPLPSFYKIMQEIYIAVWLRNLLISAGLEQVLSHTEKSCIASYNKQFSRNIKTKIIKLISVCYPGPTAPRF